MILSYIRIQNFRCHEDTIVDGLGRSSVIVGENDVGKTALLDAITTALGRRSCGPDDYRQTGPEERADQIRLDVGFLLEEHDEIPARLETQEGTLKIERTLFRSGGEQTLVHGLAGFAGGSTGHPGLH